MSGHSGLISVIIPVRNGASTLAACLDALNRQTIPRACYEVIVVDDGSIDETRQIARDCGATLLEQEPRGPAAARNLGAADANGDLLIFTDADCEPAPDFLERMSEPFSDSSLAGAKGTYRSRQRGLVPRFIQLEYEHKYDHTAKRDRIDFIETCAAAYRKDLFLANQGFDTNFKTAANEDHEFAARLARKGYWLKFVPSAGVYHRHCQDIRCYLRRKYWIGYWKSYLLRWHPERIVSDTHTPFLQRVQVAMTPIAMSLLLPALFIPVIRPSVLALMLVMVLTSIPELLKIIKRDPEVLLVAPLMILTRSLGLAVGLLVGAVMTGEAPADDKWLPLTARQRAVKRFIDILGAFAMMILGSPLLAFLALAIRLESKGPALYVQNRVGEGGRLFKMLKFRTMSPDADQKLELIIRQDESGNLIHKQKDDPRVTRMGRILRRTSLDELPQLYNVLRGEMSLVGPRPEQPWLVEQYEAWQRERLTVPQGLTGWWQINGRGDRPMHLCTEDDLYYIRNYSLKLDLQILLRTISAVLRGEGAF